MFSRSGPRTDGRCAEGPRVEWLDEEAPPHLRPRPRCRTACPYDPAPTFLKPYLCVAWWRVEWLDGEARPTYDPARDAERPARTTAQQLPKTVTCRRPFTC